MTHIVEWAKIYWDELKTPLGFDTEKPPDATTLSRTLAKFPSAVCKQPSPPCSWSLAGGDSLVFVGSHAVLAVGTGHFTPSVAVHTRIAKSFSPVISSKTRNSVKPVVLEFSLVGGYR